MDGIILWYSLSVAACQRKQHNYDGGWSSYEVLVAFRMQTFFGGPYSPPTPSKLYSYLGDYVGDPLPPLLAGSEALKGRRANYFPTRSSAQIEFRNGGGGRSRRRWRRRREWDITLSNSVHYARTYWSGC